MPPLPFLRSQKLFGLLPDADPRESVHPERFHAARRRRDEGGAPGSEATGGQPWEELSRESFLTGEWNERPLTRVALTTDAGIGKTYNLRYLHYELNAP